ncbi:sensor histidine kinase [Kitasatospora sp. NPDC092948]|uniref:sensor histidine kinase n=1 Tax=Kitasatospora sp. NPDC092948 TaxID=3364088 RepID=UPI00380A32F8
MCGLSGLRGLRLSSVVRDALVPVLFLLLLLLHVGVTRRPHEVPVAGALTVALVLPLVWWRRAPRAVFGVVVAGAFVQCLVGVQLPADAALLVALCAVAARSRRSVALVAAGVVEVGAVLACLRWATPGAVAAPLVALSAAVVAAVALGMNARTSRACLAATQEWAVRLEEQQEQQARLAVAEERARIAREVHDIVTHNLSVMVALTDAAIHAQHHAPDAAATALVRATETGRQALTDMRRSLGVLRTDEPDAERRPLPGIAELADLADRMRAAGLPTGLDVRGDHGRLPATVQLTVHRLVQEALTNTFKHAPAGTRAEVRIQCSARTVTVDITDNGPRSAPGSEAVPPGAVASSGHGIVGMRERSAAFGGTLRAGPLPGGGWRVHARLPLGNGRTAAPV